MDGPRLHYPGRWEQAAFCEGEHTRLELLQLQEYYYLGNATFSLRNSDPHGVDASSLFRDFRSFSSDMPKIESLRTRTQASGFITQKVALFSCNL